MYTCLSYDNNEYKGKSMQFSKNNNQLDQSPAYAGRLKTSEFQTSLNNLRVNFTNELGNAKDWDKFVEVLKTNDFYDSHTDEKQGENEIYSYCNNFNFGMDSMEHLIDKNNNVVTTSFYTIDFRPRKQQSKLGYDHSWDDDDGYGETIQNYSNDGYSQADLDNHANQCNPNNDAYYSSRR